MRILLLITLVVSMAVSPAVAGWSCASMADESSMAADAPMMAHDGADVSSMTAEDCADMNAKDVPSHDPGCMAACALACPGFYAGAKTGNSDTPLFKLAEYPALATLIFVAASSHLDPPPPRA